MEIVLRLKGKFQATDSRLRFDRLRLCRCEPCKHGVATQVNKYKAT